MSYPITYWYGIRKEFLSRERLIEAKEAGFNLIECSYDTETNLQVLEWCRELGLRANVNDPRMKIALAGEEGWEAALDAMIDDYYDCPAVNRFFMRDEPVDDYFPTLARVAERLHARDDRHGEYVNFLPLLAVPQIEGMTAIDRYRLHIDRYVEAVKPSLLSYDCYTLARREAKEPGEAPAARISDENRERNGWQNVYFEAYDVPGFYNNLAVMRERAQYYGLPWMSIILLVEHWGYRWPTAEELRWEAMSVLTYGSHALSYFTYWTPGVNHTEPWSYHHGIIHSDGARDEKYDIVRAINADLQAMYTALTTPMDGESELPAQITSEAVFHVGEETDELAVPFASYSALNAVTVTEGAGRLIVGCFAGERFIITNKDYNAPVTVRLASSNPLVVLDRTSGTWLPLEGDLSVAPGDAALVAAKPMVD